MFTITPRAIEELRRHLIVPPVGSMVPFIVEAYVDERPIAEFTLGFHERTMLDEFPADHSCEINGLVVLFNEPLMWERKLAAWSLDWANRRFRFVRKGNGDSGGVR